MKSMIDKEVFCKRDGTHGIVVAQDSVTITIETGGVDKVVTHSTFERWYKIVAQDVEPGDVAAIKEAAAKEVAKAAVKPAVKAAPRKHTDAEKDKMIDETVPDCMGLILRTAFLEAVKNQSNERLEFFYKPDSRQDIVKYNGRNVFECTQSKNKYTVLCHPDSLTPETAKKATKVFPKEWGWALRTQFIFTGLEQSIVMKAVVIDGLYYRHKEDTAK